MMETAGEVIGSGQIRTTMNILVVEDNPDHALLARIALEKNPGWKAEVTDTVHKASLLLGEKFFKVILTDYRLTDGNGLDFLEICGKKSIVIVMTSQGNERVAVYALQKGAYDYVIKDTFFYEVLQETIQKAIDKFDAQEEVINLREKVRQDNEKLIDANRKLKELDNIKSEFLSTASHELRTPLTIIREFVSLTKDGFGGPVTCEQHEYLDSALNNCDRLGNLIDEILDLQKIESGRISISRKKIDLADILKEQYHDFLPRFGAKKQLLTLDVEQGLAEVLCDKNMIIRVIVNLLGNANKYVPEKGSIAVKASGNSKRVLVEVEDNGPGISESDMENIFLKFTQINRAEGPGPQGAGLGLAIARNLVEINEGELQVKSTPGAGSTFFFDLPLYSDAGFIASFIHDTLKEYERAGLNVFLSLLRINRFTAATPKYDGLELQQVLEEAGSVINRMFQAKDRGMIVVEEKNIVVMLSGYLKMPVALTNAYVARALEESLDIDVDAEFSRIKIDLSMSAAEWIDQAIERLKPLTVESGVKKVLVVDDDRDVLRMISKILETSDMTVQVEGTCDGYDACIRFGNFKPDLVILDINMPRCDTTQVLRQIRKGPYSQNTRILVISGDHEKFDEMMRLGADDCLAKPFDIGILVGKISSLLKIERELTNNKGEKRLTRKMTGPLRR